MNCGQCFTIGWLCGAVTVLVCVVVAVWFLHDRKPLPAPPAEKDSVLD